MVKKNLLLSVCVWQAMEKPPIEITKKVMAEEDDALIKFRLLLLILLLCACIAFFEAVVP